MKKFFLLLITLVCSMSIIAGAQTAVSVTAEDDTYTVTVGDATFNGLTATVQNGVNVIAINRDAVKLLVRFTDANTLVADGYVGSTPLHYATAAAAAHALEYQIPSSDFENWNATVAEPVSGWHSFKTCFGTFAGAARDASKLYCSDYTAQEIAANSTVGSHYATIESEQVFTSIANGTLTTGRLQAGSMFATNAANHSEMDITKTYTDDYAQYGPFYVLLKSEPDAIKTMLKVELKNNSHKATLSAAITNGNYYQEPTGSTDYSSVLAATAGSKAIANCGWTEFSYPFTYNDGVEAKAIMVTISTNANPGQGSDGDKVSVDNVELVYNAAVNAITATGLDGFTFDAATHNYTISYEGAPISLSADNFTVAADGRAAVIVKNVEDLGGGNYAITLGAYSADMMNASVYTITVKRQPDNVWILGDVNGNDWAANVGALMNYNEEDGTYTLDVVTTRDHSYFSFTKRLGENNDQADWEAIAPYRFGANTEGEGNNFVMRDIYLGQEIELAADGRYNAFELPAGEWTFTIKNLDGDRKLIIEGEWPAARLLVQGSFNEWSSSSDDCIEMALTDGVYTADYESLDCGDGYSYFKLIKRYAGEQDVTIGAVSEGDFVVNANFLNTPLSITDENGQAYKIPAGQFTLAADLEAMTLTIGGTLPEEGEVGDVNLDGKVDVEDMNIIINVILETETDEGYISRANINGDEKIDVEDMNEVINIILTH